MDQTREVERVARQRRWCQADAELIVAAFLDSGQALADFARRWRIRQGRLQRWLDRLRPDVIEPKLDLTEEEEETSITFHPVLLTSPPPQFIEPPRPASSWLAELTRHDWTVRIPHGFDAHEIGRLLALLAEVSP